MAIRKTGTVYDGDVYDLKAALRDITLSQALRFEDTWCSQCGHSLGPGNSGVSHCEDHIDCDLLNDLDWIKQEDDNV